MSIRWYDGFEHYGVNKSQWALGGWSGVDGLGTIVTDVKRTGSYAWRRSQLGSAIRVIGNGISATENVVGCGLGYYMGILPSFSGGVDCIMQFRSSNNRSHISLIANPLGGIDVYRGGKDALSASGTLIGSSLEIMAPSTWNHIECKVKIDATAGYVKIRVNGRVFYELEDVDTVGPNAANPYVSVMAFGHFDSSRSSAFGTNASADFFDDIFVWDQASDALHDGDFIGQHGVYYLPVDEDGSYEQWVPTSGLDSFALLDEIESDGDATYIYSDAANQIDAFRCMDPPANVDEIECISVVVQARKTDNGDADLALGVITFTSAEDFGDDFPLTPNYYFYYELYPVDPATMAAWTTASLPQVMMKRTL